ncbi:TPA: minor capsid protein [Pasteurella multocida]|uniref:phage head morphogenesis protein n=1 Tax=Pasteurella multocida TaxID=747 RepID=UPI0029AA9870|nr:minor capsid protein [Pasteurella multocida]HEH9663194.1 minor capsid protein [Pasteurella multocida]HEH9676832.1 minor capsid protein [Pasteurella multocida]HEH9690176.1 minor capsid protein [Pasteurella multocida]HEH9699356.1 minor capsid protein [Pasteurella multocida]
MPNSNDLDMGYVLRLEPKLAVDYLKAKGYNITWNWQEQLEEAHVRAFTVAKVTRMEILETLHQATIQAIEQGIPEREFIKNLTPKLQELGWWGKQAIVDSKGVIELAQMGSPRRLRTILRTNKITAYHAGRYASQMENADEQPYWQYVAVRDSRTRASHLALHGKVYRYDDPIWETLYPPNDWGCRCRVRALSEFKLNKQGLKVSDSAGNIKTDWALAGVDKSSGEETHAKISILTTDKGTIKTGAGWNYNVGKAAVGSDIAVLRKLQQIQDRELRQQTIQAINNSEARHQAFENWVKANLGKRGASHRYIGAGLISENIADKVTVLSGGEKYSQRVLVMTEKSLQHANSDKHHKTGVGLTEKDYSNISRIIADSRTLVLWDKQHKNLIYISPDRRYQVIVDAPGKLKKTKEKLDAVINAYKVNFEHDVKKAIAGGNYLVIQGSE